MKALAKAKKWSGLHSLRSHVNFFLVSAMVGQDMTLCVVIV
jgi:hypothetical protein